MKLNQLKPLSEDSYPDNLGIMEMFKFYQLASSEQKKQMKSLINKKDFKRCWDLLTKVTGIKLEPVT